MSHEMRGSEMSSSDFDELIREEIRRRGGVTFAEFMGWALYHPRHGYYMTGPLRTGRQGDFFTNVQAGGLFARLLAESFTEMWDLLGSGRLTLVELGGGDGALAERVLLALKEKGRDAGVSYYLVEKSPFGRDAARRRLSRFPKVRILESLEELEHASGVEGCVFSNEFFDALPFHRVQRLAGQLRELYVREESGRLLESPGDPSTPRLERYFIEQGVRLEEGQKADVCLLLDEAVAEIDRVLARGFVLSIDYGEPSLDLYRPARSEGSRQVYRSHQAFDSPFEEIGRRDITALVDFGRIAAAGRRGDLRPLVFASQGAYFLNSAEALLRRVVEEDVGRRGNPAAAREVQQLLHPETFGGKFHILVQGKNVGEAALSGGKVNRVRRLDPPAEMAGNEAG